MSSKRRIIALLRVSTDAQDLARQRRDVKRVIAAHSLDLIRTEEVGGVSGRAVQQDPQFQTIFRDLKRPDVAGVAISALDRLFRPDFYSDFGILDHFRANKKLIFSAKEGMLDPASDAGFLMSLMSGAQAGMEWRELRRRTMQGKEEKRMQGRHVNGASTLPRGVAFDKETGKWSLTEPDATRIRKAYSLLAQRVSWRDIASQIGGGWTACAIRRSLKNPIWKGLRVYSEQTESSGGTRREAPLEVPIPIQLISPERWEAAQRLMRARRDSWAGKLHTEGSPFLAASVLRCACGCAYYAKYDHRPGKYHSYYCASRYPSGAGCGAPRLRQDIVDRVIERVITECLLEPRLLLRILASQKETPSQGEKAEAKLERELAKLEAKRKRLTDFALDGLIGKEEFSERLRALDKQRHELENLLPPKAKQTIDPRQLVQDLAKAFARFCHLKVEDKRKLLRRAVSQIRVEAGTIPSLTLAGGFLGEIAGAKLCPHSAIRHRQLRKRVGARLLNAN